MFNNIITMTDAYKVSHWKMYPPKTEYTNFYFESRGGRWNRTVFYGLQYYIRSILCKQVTKDNVLEAKDFWSDFGLSDVFNEEGWMRVVNECDGYLPLYVEAVEEGTVVPTSNVLIQLYNTEPFAYWLPGYIETTLSQVWYPITVATLSYMCKQIILEALHKSGTPETIEFKLHDFGFRGCSSKETAAIGGSAHLLNFMGTDTSVAAAFIKKYYNGKGKNAISIPASEHSVITSWGKENELESYDNFINQFLHDGKIAACVSDSYDIYNAVEHLWGNLLRDKVEASGGVLVIRPDSGNPVSVVCAVINKLMDKFGFTVNSKGYKVLPDYIRVIQGDGINEHSIKDILFEMHSQHLSSDNIAFGMGSGLLQNLERDTLNFAMKCSSIEVDGKCRDVFKSPVTDSNKTSKRGRLALENINGHIKTTARTFYTNANDNLLKPVFLNGKFCTDYSFDDIRSRIK